MKSQGNITWVEFQNERCLAYDQLATYVSEDFIHDTVIHAYWKEGK